MNIRSSSPFASLGYMKSLKIFLLSFVLLFAFGFIALAQETPSTEVTQALEFDEDVQPEDLEVEEPRLLPDNPFYFLKNWAREIQSALTFNPIKKAELKMKIANEKLIEVKKLIEEKKNQKAIEKGIDNYQKGMEELKTATEKIKEKAEQNPQVGKFLDKFIQQQTLHQQLLQKLEVQVPPQALEKIKAAEEKHLEKFGEVMNKLENKEKIQEKLEQNLEKANPAIKKTIIKIKNKILEQTQPNPPTVCAQVITSAISPEGTCQEFPTPCSVPEGWQKTEKCPE